MRGREAAFRAVVAALKEEEFVANSLQRWESSEQPDKKELNLAWEIAHGVIRRLRTLDFLAQQASKRKLALKVKERALFYTALYQCYFMTRLPRYAIVDETVKLARSYTHQAFAGFLNAVLRKVVLPPELPQGDNLEALSIRYSYPPFFVSQLLEAYGIEKTKEILEAENCPPQLMARVRNSEEPFLVVKIEENLANFAQSENYYIQNVTQACLIAQLAEGSLQPQKILDLCAAPGGKLLALHDRFPDAQLFANDVSEKKLQLLRENCDKYKLKIDIRLGRGEEYPSHTSFDLIVIDAPCSNSGVLNKRPEARWRLTEESLQALNITQSQLIQHARTLLAPQGEIWYLTCSILPNENQSITQKSGLQCREEFLFLPETNGQEGGYGVALN